MKKAILLSFVVLTVALTVGCSNGLPRNCLLRKWFCGKECYQESCYTPDTCSTCPSSYPSGVIVGEPVATESGCSTCTAPSLPAATPTITTPSPAPYSYNNQSWFRLLNLRQATILSALDFQISQGNTYKHLGQMQKRRQLETVCQFFITT